MNDAQEKMYEEFRQMSIITPFKYKLKQAAESGLLIFVKWGLAIILAFFTLQFMTNVISGSNNGTNAVLYLKELQDKGYLPKVVNGTIPPMIQNQESKNATPLK